MPRKKKEPEIKLPKVEQLPSGAYHTRVLIDGRRVSITKDSEAECIAEYMALKHGVMDAQMKDKQKEKTLEEAVTEYINIRKGYRSPSTIYGYERYKKNTFLGVMKANVYTTTDEQWQRAIADEKKKDRSAKYIKNAWSIMSAAIEAETGRRPRVMLYPKDAKERLYLDPEQIDKFVEAVQGSDVEIPALLCLSSLRRSEMLALKWDKVDLEKKVIYVHGARVQGEGGMTDKSQNKTEKSRRVVPIIPPLYNALMGAKRDGERVVGMSPCTMLRHIKMICTENGLPEVGMHGLRHSFASLAYHLQIPEMIAAEIGGWNDLGTMHKIYTHLAAVDISKRSQDFSDYFDPEKKKQKVQSGNEIGNEK